MSEEANQSSGQVKQFLYVNRRAPHGSNYAQEGLEVALIGAAFEQDVVMAYVDDGVFQLKSQQDTSDIGTKNFGATYGALGDYDVQTIYVEKESLEMRGLTEDDLMPLVYEDEDDDWEEKPMINIVSACQLAEIIDQSDVVLNF